MPTEKTDNKKTKLDELPSDDSSLEQWKEWGTRIIEKYIELKEFDKERVKKIRSVKKDVELKNKVVGYYRKRTLELEKENEQLSYSFCLWFKEIAKALLQKLKIK